jgi:hypothetical protein
MPQLTLAEHFQALDHFLTQHQSLWRPRPFVQLQLPWEADYPELSLWLRQRTLAEAEAAHNHPQRLQAPEPYASLARQAQTLSTLAALPAEPSAAHPEAVHVPGRKWQQIQAFASALRFQQQPAQWLDWCAGKGHLGRHLARDGTPLTCLEHDSQLVDEGQYLSDQHKIQARHLRQDVMAEDAALHLTPATTPVALHACGDLHVRLLQVAVSNGCGKLAIAPCCYNRITAEHYQPLSKPGRQSSLQLSREDLGLPLSETVTGGQRVRDQRDQSMARRLSFDLLQRQLRGTDQYLPTPSLPSSWLNQSLADYCAHLAQLKGLSLAADHDWRALQIAGEERLAIVRNLELVRGLFRRPLELWLALDKALYLEQNGYQVRLGSFCDYQLTPRNLLLLAEKQAVDNSVENP